MFCYIATDSSIRHSLSRPALLTLFCALVIRKLDYCSTVLAGAAAVQLNRLQSVLNAAARLVFSARKYEPTSPLLCELYWLMPERIQFRLCMLMYRCLHGSAPSYLAETIHPAYSHATRHLRSADTSTLLVPSTRRSTLGDHTFPAAAARAWNSLPTRVRNAPTLVAFRQELKTVLFRECFPVD